MLNASRLKTTKALLTDALFQAFPLSPESDLVRALKADHEGLKKEIEILKSDRALSVKRASYRRFSELLKAHAKAEEKAVYDLCVEFGGLKQDTYEGITEHEVADGLLEKIGNIRNDEKWQGAVKVLAELIEHHVNEEERDYFPEVDKTLSMEEKLGAELKYLELMGRTLHS